MVFFNVFFGWFLFFLVFFFFFLIMFFLLFLEGLFLEFVFCRHVSSYFPSHPTLSDFVKTLEIKTR